MQDFLRRRYLDLMEQTLTGVLVEDPPIVTPAYKGFYRGMVKAISGDDDPSEADMTRYQPAWREAGWDQPSRAFSMIGMKRMRNVRELAERAIAEGVPGDLMETGVWRGGASMMMKAVLDAWGESGRRVILADSFAGLPPPDAAYPADAGSDLHEQKQLAVSLEEVRGNFEALGLLDERVVFLKGWFADTLPSAPVQALAVLRLDGDMYASTIQALESLYDRVSPGGFVIVDDYRLESCRQAVHDFLDARGLAPEIVPIDFMGVWFRKP